MKKTYEQGLADGQRVKQKELCRFIDDLFLEEYLKDDQLSKEDIGNITWIVQQPRFKSFEKYLIKQSLEFLQRDKVEMGNFIKSLVHDMHTVKKQEIPDTPDEW